MLKVEAQQTVTFYKVRFHPMFKPSTLIKCATLNTRWDQTFTWRQRAASICRKFSQSTGRGSSKTFHQKGAAIFSFTFLLTHSLIELYLIIRVNDMSFPANLEAFFAAKDGLKVQSPGLGSPVSKAIVEKGSDEKETLQPTGSTGNPHDEARASSSPPRSASPCTACPLCSKSFPLEVMVNFMLVKNALAMIVNPGA